MVNSILVPDIKYEEPTTLMPEDKNQEVSIYEITLYGKDEEVALGQAVYTFIERNLVYYPIYLVKNDKVTKQIGLYEVFADDIVNILDADGDVELEKLSSPLLYGYVLDEEKKRLNREKDDNESEIEGNSEDDDNDIDEDIIDESLITFDPLPEQTKTEAELEKESYLESKDNHWIQSYFENNNYRMIDNEGKGDCLFAVIRDALAKVGVYKSVDEMRKILADNVTEDVFQGYKMVYQDAFDADAQLLKEIKILVSRHKELKTKISSLKDRNEKQSVIKQADEIKKRHNFAKIERAYTKSVIEGELEMMRNVHNLTQFKALIQTCSFWGDTWAISTLERVMNIKIVLFSEENYKHGDIDNVLTCGQLNDTVLEEKGIFTPDYYILSIYQGYHYQLISYKDRGALTFKELPYDIKSKVIDKCLERLAGPYYIIPDFREMKEKLKEPKEKKDITKMSTVNKEELSQLDKDIEERKTIKQHKPQFLLPEIPQEMQSDLYDNSTVFQFYSKSVGKPLPGKGAGETISDHDKPNYKELSQIPDWRKKLSNFWIDPFVLDGHRWNSVEHYYQGSKFKRDNPEFYLKFSLDSGTALSKDPAMAKGAGGKTGKYLKEQIRPKNISADEDFFGKKRGVKEMEAAQFAKFSQNVDLKNLLLKTHKAKLQHFARGSPPIVFYDLMIVRQKLV